MPATDSQRQSGEQPREGSEKSLYDDPVDSTAFDVEKLATKLPSRGSSDTPRYSQETSSIHPVESVPPNAVARTLTAADWDGPQDPENPWNWSLSKRVYQTAMTGLFGFTVYVDPLLRASFLS